MPGGFGERGAEGKIEAAQFARERNVPYFGICFGMQMAVIEAARNLAGIEEANSTEFGPTPEPVVGLMTEWIKGNELEKRTAGGDLGGTMRLGAYPAMLTRGSRVAEIYGTTDITERHRHRYEVNIDYKERLEQRGLRFSGMSPDGVLPEIVEFADHPWFIGVQFHPELKSKPFEPHPLFASLHRGGGGAEPAGVISISCPRKAGIHAQACFRHRRISSLRSSPFLSSKSFIRPAIAARSTSRVHPDAAAALYRGLGFTVGSRNRHPWGTHNHIVQLPGFFIELLTLAEPDKLGSDGFSQLFGAYNRDFLKSHEGLSLLILKSRDADADEKDFRAAAIAASDVMRFEREGRRPDGSSVKPCVLARFRRRHARPANPFRHLPAALSGEFLEPGVSEARQQRDRHRRCCRRCRQARATPRLHAGICRRAGRQWRERIHHRHAARHNRNDDTRRLHPPLWRGGAGRHTRRAACRHPFHRRRCEPLQNVPELAGVAGLYEGNAADIGADDAMGAVIVFEPAR